MKLMKIFITLFFVNIATLCCASVEGRLGAHLGTNKDGIKMLKISLEISNRGEKPVTLPSANLGPLIRSEDTDLTVDWSYSPKHSSGGGFLNESLCQFLPILLRPGETLEISHTVALPDNFTPERVGVVYSTVHPKLAPYAFDAVKIEIKDHELRPKNN